MNAITSAFSRTSGNLARCLHNIPSPDSILGTPVCGDGIIQGNEVCDCGYPQVCVSESQKILYRDGEYFSHAAKQEMMACNPFLTSLFMGLHILIVVYHHPCFAVCICFLVSTLFGTSILSYIL